MRGSISGRRVGTPEESSTRRLPSRGGIRPTGAEGTPGLFPRIHLVDGGDDRENGQAGEQPEGVGRDGLDQGGDGVAPAEGPFGEPGGRGGPRECCPDVAQRPVDVRAGQEQKPGHRRQDHQELEGLDPEIEAQHAGGQRPGIEPEFGQRRRERQAVYQPEAAGDEDFSAAEDRNQGMDGRNQNRHGNR